MFPTDAERIIPRRRGSLGQFIMRGFQVILVLLFLAYFAFAEIFPEFFEQFPRLIETGLWIPIIVIPILFVIYTRWSHHRKWAALADEMGLTLEQKKRGAFPTIMGTYRAHRVEISKHVEGGGQQQVSFTDILVNLNFETRETLTIQSKKITDLNREKTGIEEIDKKLTVVSSSKRLVQRVLNTRRLCLGLLQLGENSRTRRLMLNGKTLHYRERGDIGDKEYLRAALVFLVDLSNVIEGFAQMGL